MSHPLSRFLPVLLIRVLSLLLPSPLYANPMECVLQNTTSQRLGFYYYTKAYQFVEFYLDPGASHPLSLESPCWIVQLSKYQTPYFLDETLNADTVGLTADVRGIAYLTPRHSNDAIRLNQLNTFGFISARLSGNENETLLAITRAKTCGEIDRIVRERYDHALALLRDYAQTHPLSPAYEALARQELALTLQFYQLHFIQNLQKKGQPIGEYMNLFDSLYRGKIAAAPVFSQGLPFYDLEYKFFLFHCSQLLHGQPPASMQFSVATSEISDPQVREKVRFLILDNALKTHAAPDSLTTLFLKDCRDAAYRSAIEERLEENGLRNVAVAGDWLLTGQKIRLPFEQLIKQNAGRLIYIDLWASWCGPCRAEMPASRKLQETYRDKAVTFVYISIDQSIVDWQKGCMEERLVGAIPSYLLLDFEHSAIRKNFRVNTIPHYIVVGRSGKMLDNDAPRPGDPHLRSILDKALKH